MPDQNNPKPFPTWLIFLFQGVVIILSIAIGYFGNQFIAYSRSDFGLLRQAHAIMLENTILDIPDDPTLEYGMIRGMLAELEDPYSGFVEPATHEIMTDELAGRFGGIGVRLERDTQAQWRLYPLPDSPALTAGIQDGDLLLAVDDLLVSPHTDEVTLLAAVRGPEGETVSITIDRDGDQLIFDIKRQSVPLPSITWHLLPEAPKIGMLRVHRIAETTAEEMQSAIESLLDQGMTGLIIDLQDNGGGLVEAGVDIVRLFLRSGEVIAQSFKGEEVRIFEVDQPGPFTDLPLVLLINHNTASSAEIVAGALKAHQRGILVGTSTHGKTSIQLIYELSDGSSVHITSGRWWVDGQSFPLAPDLEVLDDPSGVESLRTALQVFNP
ncbi:MAG: PDZ domain-containing protein [Brevefilum sp.]|nr:PDZ domain-containing protein [Brevefilum sp.]